MKFGWVITSINNRSIESLCFNLTEYVTAELLSQNINVEMFKSKQDAIDNNVNKFAEIGTLFSDSIYDQINEDTISFDINNSEFLIFDQHNILKNLYRINEAVDHRNFFVENTEEFENTYIDKGISYDCCVCSAAGDTPNKIFNSVKLKPESIIYVVDINSQALELAKTKIKNLSQFRFVHIDLFDTARVKEFLKSVTSQNNLWFVSNIFNYVNTSLIYDYDLRFHKQQEFINLLAAENNNWDISIYTTDCRGFQNTPSRQLSKLKNTIDLEILPWVSCYQPNSRNSE